MVTEINFFSYESLLFLVLNKVTDRKNINMGDIKISTLKFSLWLEVKIQNYSSNIENTFWAIFYILRLHFSTIESAKKIH